VESVRLDYEINEVAQPSQELLWNEVENNEYTFTISFPVNSLSVGDVIKYRITARDTAEVGNASGNLAYSPSSTTYHVVDVTGLQPARDFYVNNFNTSTPDFFGEGFDIETPEGFTDGAIHTLHPYIPGISFPNEEINTMYQLLIPIKVKASGATVKFEEIVLVEPGEAGAEFGDVSFYDYVVVEGSTDGGTTWTPLADGYDSRNNADWLTRYNSDKSGGSSSAVGDPSLYRTRTLDMLGKFTAGQEVILRFRLYSDAFSVGWGWAIDNLRIQIDDTPPTILHDHIDYILASDTELDITTIVTDAGIVESVEVEYGANGGETQTSSVEVNPEVSEYTLTLELEGFSAGDVIQYRIIAKDTANNVSTFPDEGFINTTIFSPGTAVNEYENNFNTETNDFIGNFFSVTTADGFDNAAINTEHKYQNGMGLDLTSSYKYMLTKPVILNADNPYIKFDEVAIVEGQASSIHFGSESFNDYVIVEGSSDGGETWHAFADGYDAVGQPTWVTAFNNGASGTKSMFKSRTINMLDESGFAANDQVLVRFRLFVNDLKNGWGWAIDNLSIQGSITAVEEKVDPLKLHLYPNPASEKVTVEIDNESAKTISLNIINVQGQSVSAGQFKSDGKTFVHEVDIRNMPAGLYIMRAYVGDKVFTKKFAKGN
jgi:hypothetical protein